MVWEELATIWNKMTLDSCFTAHLNKNSGWIKCVHTFVYSI